MLIHKLIIFRRMTPSDTDACVKISYSSVVMFSYYFMCKIFLIRNPPNGEYCSISFETTCQQYLSKFQLFNLSCVSATPFSSILAMRRLHPLASEQQPLRLPCHRRECHPKCGEDRGAPFWFYISEDSIERFKDARR